MWRLLSHLVLLATASASLVISEVADKGAADACDGEEWIDDPANGADDQDHVLIANSPIRASASRATAPRGCSSTTRTRRTT